MGPREQWARTTAGIKEAAVAITHGEAESKSGVAHDRRQPWRNSRSSTINAQPQSEWQMATVTVVPDKSYDFRYDASVDPVPALHSFSLHPCGLCAVFVP